MFRRSPLQPRLQLTSRLLTSNRPLHAPLMSSQSKPPSPQNPLPESSHPPSHPEKALPAPPSQDGVTTLDISGGDATVKLDALGPMVVNQDGTIARISNWSALSDMERTNTLRIIGKRNQTRLAALRKAQEPSTGSSDKNENGGRDDQNGQK